MKQVTTLVKPDDGLICYNGKNIFDMGDEYRDIIGYLPQEFGVYKNFTAKQFLEYVGALKGLKRRVGIAQVLLNDPKIIVLDEPTAGLDPQERTRFRNLIAKISRDKIIILSTHIISDIESVDKETIMVKNGKLLMKGTHKEILSDMANKVYSISVKDESEVDRIQSQYKVVSIQRDVDSTVLRVVSSEISKEANIQSEPARFEDVYMFYFDLEDAKAV